MVGIIWYPLVTRCLIQCLIHGRSNRPILTNSIYRKTEIRVLEKNTLCSVCCGTLWKSFCDRGSVIETLSQAIRNDKCKLMRVRKSIIIKMRVHDQVSRNRGMNSSAYYLAKMNCRVSRGHPDMHATLECLKWYSVYYTVYIIQRPGSVNHLQSIQARFVGAVSPKLTGWKGKLGKLIFKIDITAISGQRIECRGFEKDKSMQQSDILVFYSR